MLYVERTDAVARKADALLGQEKSGTPEQWQGDKGVVPSTDLHLSVMEESENITEWLQQRLTGIYVLLLSRNGMSDESKRC